MTDLNPREHMPIDTRAIERILRATATPPCCSLYLPTHRTAAHKELDRARYRNLVNELTKMTAERHGADRAAAILGPMQDLADQKAFWADTQDGLAVFAAPDLFEVFVLQRSVPERVFCSDSFHTKPLRRILQSADRFAVLGISRSHIRLFVGNRDRLDPVVLPPGVPRTLEDALGSDKTAPVTTVASHHAGPRSDGMFHGHGSHNDDVNRDTERFFRVIDKAVTEHFSAHNHLPLILVGLAEHHATYRGVSHNPHLLPEGIAGNPDVVDGDGLREKAWALMEPFYVKRLNGLIEKYGDHKAHAKGDDDVAAVAAAAVQGRVRTLLVDADLVLPGVLDRNSGEVTAVTQTMAGVDDLLDDIAEVVTSRGGEVVIVPSQKMPSSTGLAAIYGY
jgi:peptide subunit release factor 1 (eRF1)